MATATVENIVALINQLPELERARLIAELAKTQPAKLQLPKGRIISTNAPYEDRRLDYEWLATHRREHIGKWIALKDGNLVAEGETGREVFAKVKELGVELPLVLLVEDPDISYMGF
jgi:hypothetical protein